MAKLDNKVLSEQEILEKESISKRNAAIARTFFNIKKGIIYFCLTLLAVICLIPFLLMMINATRSSTDIQTSFTLIPGGQLVANMKLLFSKINLLKGMWNSLIVAVPATILSSYFAALTGYALAMYKFKGRGIVFGVTVVFMMIPGQLSMIGFYSLCQKLGILNTYWPLILPAIAATGTVFFLRQYILSILPRTLLEAARIDGGTELGIFHRIVIPLIIPGIATMAIGAFIGSWNAYLMPLIIITSPEKETLPLMMTRLNDSLGATDNVGATYAGIAVSVLPIIIAFCFFSKYIIGSITAGGVKE